MPSSWLGWFAGNATVVADTPSTASRESVPPDAIRVLVIQEDNYDWGEIFQNRLLALPAGTLPAVQVVQTSWKSLCVGPCSNQPRNPRLVQLSNSGFPAGFRRPARFGHCQVTVTDTYRNGKRQSLARPLTFFPDFVLVRNEVTTPTEDHRNDLLGLMYAGVPSVNSLHSILMCCDKPVVQAALHRARTKRFAGDPERLLPLIAQYFFPSSGAFFYGDRFPAVVKFGTAHAGYGKLRVKDHHDMQDVQGLLCMTKDGYATAEPFVEGQKDLRIQKIGNSYRTFERVGISGDWKTNTGSAILVEVPVQPHHKRYADVAASLFGSDDDVGFMEILTVDCIVAQRLETAVATQPTGDADASNEAHTHILEVNGTSSGLCPDTEHDDNNTIADLVLEKLKAIFVVAETSSSCAAAAS